MNIHVLLDHMWQHYLQLNPQVRDIYQLFSRANGGHVVNDHIALRTFNYDKIDIQRLALPFTANGYYCAGEYEFPDKKLYARHFQHDDPSLPKVFISELLVEQLSSEAQQIIHGLVSQIDVQRVNDHEFCYSGRPWSVSYSDYQRLLNESEYAAWMSAFGYRPNHFTVLVNALKSHDTLEQVNEWLLSHGYALNNTGGLIKGSPDVFLEQSSTLANKVLVQFSDCEVEIPSCFYEFAYRYPLPNGELYQGFVASSADKIFESTDVA